MNEKSPSTSLPWLSSLQDAIASLLIRILIWMKAGSVIVEDGKDACLPTNCNSLDNRYAYRNFWRSDIDPGGERYDYIYRFEHYCDLCEACIDGTCVQKVIRYDGCAPAVVHDCRGELD